jgi:hydroxylamine dehydrogenase
MKETCLKCHTRKTVDVFYDNAELVVESTNDRVREAQQLMEGLRADGLLTPEPFDEPIEFLYFDYWHYFGRTAKHGAFMGGADYVQWHGNYELLLKFVEMKDIAEQIRRRADENN